MAAAATTQQPPSVFTFRKHGVLLPASRCGLFLKLVAVSAALSTVLHLFKPHSLQLLLLAVANLRRSSRGRDVGVEALATLVESFLTDQGWHLLAGAAYLVADIALGFAIRIAAVSAAVAAFSGELHTCLSFLRKVKGNPTRPVVTVALGYLLKVAFVRAIVLYHAAFSRRPTLDRAILGVLLVLFYHFLDAVCAVADVASVAEPGLRGAGAMERAWRLMSGADGQAALYVFGTLWLGRAVSQVCTLTLALGWMMPPTAAVLATYLLLGVEKVFSAVTITAYYFEHTKCNVEDQKAGHRE